VVYLTRVLELLGAIGVVLLGLIWWSTRAGNPSRVGTSL
jgi:hypothetical protein